MVIRVGVVVGLFVIVWHQFLSAAEIKPLGNGYSGVAPQSAALLRAQPVAEIAPLAESMSEMPMPMPMPVAEEEGSVAAVDQADLSAKLEKGADKMFSSKDGVSAALGAALTATVSSNPAVVLVGGFAGIWASEQKVSYKGNESMPLGEGSSNLFRTVSKTFFRGGRALVEGSKKLVSKTGKSINKLRYANAPLPLKGQEEKFEIETKAKPVVGSAAHNGVEKLAAAPRPATTHPEPKVMKPVIEKALSPVMMEAKKTESIVEEVPAKSEVIADAVVKEMDPMPEKSKTVKASTAVDKPLSKAPAKKKPVEKPKLVTKNKADTVLRASTKKLEPMPKLASAENSPQPELMQQELIQEKQRPWPEQDFSPEQEKPPGYQALTAQIDTPRNSSFQAYTPPVQDKEKEAVKVTQVVDCDGAGGKVSRGRLAWMECYYRMDEE